MSEITNRIKFLCLVFIILFYSCRTNQENTNVKPLLKERDIYLNLYFNDYKSIYNIASDSINKWRKDSLGIVKCIFFDKYELDSVFIFNKDSTLFFTSINHTDGYKYGEMDYLNAFGGRKINGKWCVFFGGVSTVLPREGMQDSMYSPFSFEELRYLAYKESFEPYVRNVLSGQFEKNEKRFYRNYSTWQECPTKVKGHIDWKCIDSMLILSNRYIYNGKMSKKEVAEIQNKMDNSVSPPLPKKEKIEWWQFWKEEPPVPFFESEEWKNHLKQKYGKDWEKYR
jgi:hypothetical protein